MFSVVLVHLVVSLSFLPLLPTCLACLRLQRPVWELLSLRCLAMRPGSTELYNTFDIFLMPRQPFHPHSYSLARQRPCSLSLSCALPASPNLLRSPSPHASSTARGSYTSHCKQVSSNFSTSWHSMASSLCLAWCLLPEFEAR